MDVTMNRRDADGKLEVCCPQCRNWYKPALGERTPSGNIPEGGTPIENEQLITGLCSDACYDRWLGI